jgi:protein-S-isoprenylcysteine O-methyltransferase Ste14
LLEAGHFPIIGQLARMTESHRMDQRTTRLNALESRIPPPLVGLAVAALMWLAASYAPAFHFELPGRGLLAAGFAVVGGLLDLAGLLSFRRAGTTINPLRPSAAASLVIAGVYRVSRNPMYLGMAALLSGWGLWLANALSLAAMALFIVYMNRFQIGPEERALAQLFGQDYLDYTRRVRRWL